MGFLAWDNSNDSKRILSPHRNTMSRFVIQSALLSFALALPVWPAPARGPQSQQNQQGPKDQKNQQGQQDQSQNGKQEPGESSSSSSSSSSVAPGLTQELQQEDSKYDPFPSEQDVEIGTFYMHKGDVDAAIARFEDAIRLRSNFAKPRLLLAEIYEKKSDKVNAVKYYKEYLQVYPHAPDAAKVQKKIEKLTTR